jgi:hypothetical protein
MTPRTRDVVESLHGGGEVRRSGLPRKSVCRTDAAIHQIPRARGPRNSLTDLRSRWDGLVRVPRSRPERVKAGAGFAHCRIILHRPR